MLTKKRVYGTTVKKVNGKTRRHIEYDGIGDGRTMILNVNNNGRRQKYEIPDRQSMNLLDNIEDHERKNSILSEIMQIEPEQAPLIKRLKLYSPSPRRRSGTRRRQRSQRRETGMGNYSRNRRYRLQKCNPNRGSKTRSITRYL
tara:strand:- start:954 stop:1385 length:432 start_codon:yes stop_codon:yes gene_type:complete